MDIFRIGLVSIKSKCGKYKKMSEMKDGFDGRNMWAFFIDFEIIVSTLSFFSYFCSNNRFG